MCKAIKEKKKVDWGWWDCTLCIILKGNCQVLCMWKPTTLLHISNVQQVPCTYQGVS